jgi:ERCC4-related helicase
VVMTFHALYNDLCNGLYTLRNVSLIVFDECHRGTGEHDCVPDQIRAHQRRNRAGKQRRGKIIVLITRDIAE